MKKLYGEFNREDWLKATNLKKSDVPEAFIVHGEWEYSENIKVWKEIFQHRTIIPKWNTVIGEYSKVKIGFSNVFWAPSAGIIVHQFGSMGTEKFIQTGYMGGLSNSVKYGDIFIVSEAKMLEGVSHWYLPELRTIKADEGLLEKAISLLNMSDQLIAGDTLYNYTDERELIEEETDIRIRKLALFLAGETI